jgi:two-component SAPR family response regulator
LRRDRVDRLQRDENVGEIVSSCGSTGVQTGRHAEAVACHIKQRFPNLPIILLSAYYEIPERILWLVDEYVMKSELPEGLMRIIERATHPYWPAPHYSSERYLRGGAAA